MREILHDGSIVFLQESQSIEPSRQTSDDEQPADAKEKLDAWYSVCRKNADLVASGGLATLKEAA